MDGKASLACNRTNQSRLAGWCFVVIFQLSFFYFLSSETAGAESATAAGVPESSSSSGDAGSGHLLNGSAKDRAELNPSVKLLPPEQQHHILNGNTNVKQFNGQAQFRPGSPVYPAKVSAPAFHPVAQTPHSDFFRPILPARIVIQRPHVPFVYPAVPKWNYTLTPRNGIMTWAPGYQISHVAQQNRVAIQQTQNKTAVFQPNIDGKVRSSNTSPAASWSTTGAKLSQAQTASLIPAAVALQATPKLLTQASAGKERKSLNWQEWFRRVCNVIYAQWKLDGACPGKACVRVSVWPGREIEAKVLSFTPLEDVKRDSIQETEFRETALRAINSLGKTETLDFPEQSARSKIVFDLDMTRSVNGPSGCQVAAFHDMEEMTTVRASGSAKTAKSVKFVKAAKSSKAVKTMKSTKG